MSKTAPGILFPDGHPPSASKTYHEGQWVQSGMTLRVGRVTKVLEAGSVTAGGIIMPSTLVYVQFMRGDGNFYEEHEPVPISALRTLTPLQVLTRMAHQNNP